MQEKEIEKLQAEKEKVERQLAQEQHKIQRLENRAAYYEKGDRRKRARRLITRGAAIESVAPQTKDLSETAFYAFVEQVFALPDAQRTKRVQHIHIRYDGLGFIPLNELMNKETA